MKPYKELKIERRSVWLSVAMGIFVAILAFIVIHEISRDSDLALIMAGIIGILTMLLWPERFGSR